MNVLKSSFVLFVCITLIGFSSCSKDEPCVAPEIPENIIGTWQLDASDDEVEFKFDGTLIDAGNSLYFIEINGEVYDQKIYTLDGTDLTITASPTGGTATANTSFEVTQNECNEIKLEFAGFLTRTLRRK